MSYLCGEDFKPYILSGHSPPILAISINSQSLRLCRSIFQITDSPTAGLQSGASRSITGTGSAISGRSPSVSSHEHQGRLQYLKSIDVPLLPGEHLTTMFNSVGTNVPKPFRPIDLRLTALRISLDIICSCRLITASLRLETNIFQSRRDGDHSRLCILSSYQLLRLMTETHFESTSRH